VNILTNETFEELIKNASIKPRFKRDLKFTKSTENMDESAWANTELLPIWNKSEQGGVLLVQLDDQLRIFPFDASKSNTDTTGRMKSVICDFCYTWRASGEGGFVTFYPFKGGNSVSFLCCRDLRCSEHVRGKTDAALRSRTQIRENISPDERIERLRNRLDEFIKHL
jgi:hypothetical protein